MLRRIIIHDLHSSDIQQDQIAGETGVTRSIIDELHSWKYPRGSNGR